MQPSLTRFVVVEALCLLMLSACGGSSAALSEQARARAGSEAQSAILQSNGQTEDATLLGNFGQSIGLSLSTGDLGSIDISGLPTPEYAALARRAPRPMPSASVKPSAVMGSLGTGDSAGGCVTPDTSSGAAQARFDSVGANGCDAPPNVVEVTFVNGDDVEYTFTDSSVHMVVTGGDYVGTNVTYSWQTDDTTSSVTLRTDGTIQFNDGTTRENTLFNMSYSAGGDSNGGRYAFDGDVADLINHRKVSSSFSISVENTAGGNGGSSTITWSGNATITQLDDLGQSLTAGKVEWRNIDVIYAVVSTSSSYDIRITATGEVLFEDDVVGRITNAGSASAGGATVQGAEIEVLWTDGVTTPFDFTAFFTFFA